MESKNIFSLSLETLKQLPDAVSVEDGAVMIDNTYSPHITLLSDAWKDTPVQLDTIMTIFCTDGEANVRIAFDNYTLRENSVCVLTPGQVVEILSVTENFHCITLAISKDFINLEQTNTLEIIQLFKFVQHLPCYALTGTYATRYRETFNEAVKTANWLDNPLRVRMIQSYVYLLYCCLYPVLMDGEKAYVEDRNMSHQKEIYFRFMEMLQNNYREERTVAYYAEAMDLTPKYLSKIVQLESGESALKWIENFVILEAKALLKQRDASIQAVSERLNFPDQSSFGKYFRRVTGMSPKEYREK